MGSKEGKKGKKEHKEHRSGKGKKQHKRDKGQKKHTRRRRDASGSGSSDDSDSSGGAQLGVQQQLKLSRAAARAAREILAHDYALRGDLREVGAREGGGHAREVAAGERAPVATALHHAHPWPTRLTPPPPPPPPPAVGFQAGQGRGAGRERPA